MTAGAQQPPTRIVSLVPSATEMLFAMGAGPRVAAVSSYDRFPPEVGRLPRVGALVDPDVERILSLRPDLVVAYASQTDLLAQLGRAGIPVHICRHGSLADITAGMRDLGRRIGMQADADRAAAGIERGLGRGPRICRRASLVRGPSWSSAASPSRCARSASAADSASCTTCSISRAATTSSAT